jgi:predicted metal-dependent hydrolase
LNVPLNIEFNSQNRERAVLRKDCIQIYLCQTKSDIEIDNKIQHHTEKLLRSLLYDMIYSRLEKYTSISGLQYKNLRIKKMKSRWGSCSSMGNLNFNIGLSLVPIRILDYVVVHELCHLKELNHSTRFWNEVGKLLPSYKSDRKWLRENELRILSYFYNLETFQLIGEE